MNPTASPRTPAVTRPARDPRDLTPCQEQALDRIIGALRSGRINNTVVRHLEVDGVWRLEPLLQLTNATPCPN